MGTGTAELLRQLDAESAAAILFSDGNADSANTAAVILLAMHSIEPASCSRVLEALAVRDATFAGTVTELIAPLLDLE